MANTYSINKLLWLQTIFEKLPGFRQNRPNSHDVESSRLGQQCLDTRNEQEVDQAHIVSLTEVCHTHRFSLGQQSCNVLSKFCASCVEEVQSKWILFLFSHCSRTQLVSSNLTNFLRQAYSLLGPCRVEPPPLCRTSHKDEV